MPFKINFSVVAFFIIGVLLALYAAAMAWELWFAADASWDRILFAMVIFSAPLALAFFALAVAMAYYSKKYRVFPSPSRQKVLKVLGLTVIGIAVWAVTIVYLPWYITKKINIARTAETPAEIVSERETTSSGGKGKVIRTYIVRYTYTIGDSSYEAVSRSLTQLKKGAKVKACYNPTNPQSSQIREVFYQCGQDSID